MAQENPLKQVYQIFSTIFQIMSTTKINFSAQELILMCDTDFLLTKRTITEKVYTAFGELVKSYSSLPIHKQFHFPNGCDSTTGKISKGENYLGLPYITLDFPRLFDAENIFAFRTMFWWGNFFSFTLLLQGESFESYKANIYKKINKLNGNNAYICINESQWHHHFENDNYIKIEDLKTKAQDLPFFKISRKLELKDIANLEKFGTETYNLFLSVLQ